MIRACAEAERDDDGTGTWIDAEIYASYVALHQAGYAHSVEAWQDGRLAGGLYGVAIAGAFFGESMFHHVTDASKVALVALVDRLRHRGYVLLDTQWVDRPTWSSSAQSRSPAGAICSCSAKPSQKTVPSLDNF